MNTKFVTILTLGALPFIAMAMPTKAELDKVSPVVADLMKPEQEALKAGKKSKSEVAAVALDLVGKADGEAAKLLLTKGAYNLYVRDGDFDKAIETLKSFREIVPDMEPQYLANIIESSLRTISRKNGGQLYQFLDETRTIARYRDELKKLEAQAKKTPTDKSLQLKLAEHYAVLNDWPKALAAFEQSTDRKAAEAAKAETSAPHVGEASSPRQKEKTPTTLKHAADHWWNYPVRKAPEFEKPFRQHAAKLYEQAIASGELVGLNKVQAGRRIEEAKALGEAAYETPVTKDGLYCVIDLSSGPNAKRYPVSYLNAVPKGGWTDEYKTTKIVLRKIEPGSSMMGDLVHGGKGVPPRHVSISNTFYIGVFEITQRQWELVMGNRPSHFCDESSYAMRPVEKVAYTQIGGSMPKADTFLGKVRVRTTLNFGLPTEEQWEYACRAGTKTDFSNGQNYRAVTKDPAMDEVGRYWGNGGWKDEWGTCDNTTWVKADRKCDLLSGTAKVGSYKPNSFGLYDMHGNVSEWVARERWKNENGTAMMRKGGDFVSGAAGCVSFVQSDAYEWQTILFIGFRLAIQPAIVAPRSVDEDKTLATAKREMEEEVAAQREDKLYCVIDLSGGPNAKNYPVSYLNSAPKTGWSEEYKTTKLVLRKIKPGKFRMGDAIRHAKDCADVVISKPYYVGVLETTQRQWELVMGDRPAWSNNDACYPTRPIEQVSYASMRGSDKGSRWPQSNEVDGNSFIGRLRQKSQVNFDLPTEAQWEFACRAGTTTDFNNGESGDSDSAMRMLGRFAGNALQDEAVRTQDVKRQERGLSDEFTTAKVGCYRPNGWGLYDMHGNVDEMCLDWADCIPREDGRASWRTGKLLGGTDPKGINEGRFRIVRGGSWSAPSKSCGSSSRAFYGPDRGRSTIGFRLAIQPK